MNFQIRQVAFCFALLGFGTFSQLTSAEILFADDFENGEIRYDADNPHPGGGYISWMGGALTGARGNGTQDVYSYHNVVHDNSTDAAASVAGSKYALKTHYSAGFAQDYQRNTTVLRFPESEEIYIRWYQKWSKDWEWPSDQQKFIKIKNLEDGVTGWTQNFMFAWGADFQQVHSNFPESNGASWFMAYADRSKYPDTNKIKEDDINNHLGAAGTDGNFHYETNRWYCIEMHVKANSIVDGKAVKDGINEIFVDGKLVYHHQLVNRGITNKGLNRAELQHVYQLTGDGRTTHDQPTWMDNLVISTQYIGLDPNHIDRAPISSAAPMPPAEVAITLN